MRRLTLFLLLALAAACDETPASVAESPSYGIVGSDTPAGDAGAVVLNRGAATPTGFCTFRGRFTDEITGVVSPNGNALLSCQHDDYFLPEPIEQPEIVDGWTCFLTYQGSVLYTTKSHFVVAPNGQATQTCHFEGDRTPPPQGDEKVGDQCRGAIVSGIASTWPYPESQGGPDFFAPPPGALALWLQAFAPYGVTTVQEAMDFFCT